MLLLLGCLTAGGEDLEWEEVKSRIRRSFPTVSQLSTIELAEWLATDADSRPLLLDARTPEEYAVSHLAGAFLTPSLEEAVRKVDSVEEGRPIVVYCSVGYRSSQLAEGLAAKGYPNIYNLEGSIFQWANEGRDLYRGNEKVESVHPFDEQWGQLLRRDLWLRSAD